MIKILRNPNECMCACYVASVVSNCLWTVAHQVPVSWGFSRQEYWSGLPFPPPGDLPDSRIESGSPALQVDSLPAELKDINPVRSDQLLSRV